MASGRMRYIRQRMAEKPRTDIELTPLKAEIEAIFSERNIDEDCDTIARLLSPYRETVRYDLLPPVPGKASGSGEITVEKGMASLIWRLRMGRSCSRALDIWP